MHCPSGGLISLRVGSDQRLACDQLETRGKSFLLVLRQRGQAFQTGSLILESSGVRQSDTSCCTGAARNASASEPDTRERSANSHSEASQDREYPG